MRSRVIFISFCLSVFSKFSVTNVCSLYNYFKVKRQQGDWGRGIFRMGEAEEKATREAVRALNLEGGDYVQGCLPFALFLREADSGRVYCFLKRTVTIFLPQRRMLFICFVDV